MTHPLSLDWFFDFFGKKSVGSPENPPVPVGMVEDAPVLDIQEREQPARQRRDFDLKSQEAQRLFVFGTPSLSGVSVNNDTALTLPPMFGAIRLISEGLAMLDRKVKRKKNGRLQLLDDHPVTDFLEGRPHSDYTWFDFLAALFTNACLGNGYARIWWDNKTMRPRALEHIPQGLVWPERNTVDGTLWYRVSGELNGRMVTWTLPQTEMLHIKGFSLNAITGRPTALMHRPTLGAGIAAQQYTESIFGKGARPSIAIKSKDELLASEVRQIEDEIMNRHGGSENAGRPLVLDNGMEVVYLQWSPVDVALVDFRRLNVEDVSMITLVPVEMLMSQQKSGTYGAAVQRTQNFLTHCLGPWIEKFQEEFNSKIFYASERRRGGRVYFEFDTAMYLSLDKKSEAEVLKTLVGSSIMTPNEARERLGLDPAEGGDVLFGSINQLPIKDVAQIALAKYLSAQGEALQIRPDGDVVVGEDDIDQKGTNKGTNDQQNQDTEDETGQSAAN